MKRLEDMQKIPATRLRREYRKHSRGTETLLVTVSGQNACVFSPEKSQEYTHIVCYMSKLEKENIVASDASHDPSATNK